MSLHLFDNPSFPVMNFASVAHHKNELWFHQIEDKRIICYQFVIVFVGSSLDRLHTNDMHKFRMEKKIFDWRDREIVISFHFHFEQNGNVSNHCVSKVTSIVKKFFVYCSVLLISIFLQIMDHKTKYYKLFSIFYFPFSYSFFLACLYRSLSSNKKKNERKLRHGFHF